MSKSILSAADLDHFLTKGYIIVRECFPREAADEWAAHTYRRIGCDPKDPATWSVERIHLPGTHFVAVREFAPKLLAAATELIGGEEKAESEWMWSDASIVNFNVGADKPWQAPSPDLPGWHKDGDFFLHFLDSPEQGLLTLVAWTDIHHQGGGTFIATDSVPVIARYLAARPEGVEPNGFGFPNLIRECREFVEITASAGDVVLLHPYMMHTISQNVLGTPRIITNPPISLKEPMRFDRAPGEHSAVEQAVLRGLGVDRLDFKITSERQRIVPDRVLKEQKMLEEERKRLAQAA